MLLLFLAENTLKELEVIRHDRSDIVTYPPTTALMTEAQFAAYVTARLPTP